MAKNFITVRTTAELASVWVSEFDEGAWAYVAATQQHYTLFHVAGGPVAGQVDAAPGAPRAGSPTATWIPTI